MLKENSFVENFDVRVEEALKDLGFDFSCKRRVGLAVSGGADSIALLTSLFHICKKYSISLFVITVNHKIRSDEESGGDAQFVFDYCKYLSSKDFVVTCDICNLTNGLVFEQSKLRGAGVEEAARFLRYEAFESFILQKKLDCLCLAHNQNDQLETLVMRFLQGSGGLASAGIKKTREKYFRPLLTISRPEIELYLTNQKISWRTDKTNFDNKYLRNRVRNLLMPELDKIVPGWRKSVVSGAQKALDDAEYIENEANNFCWKKDKNSKNSLFMELSELNQIPVAVRCRLFYKAANELNVNLRIPYSFIKKCENLLLDNLPNEQKKCSIFELQARISDNRFFIEKLKNKATYSSFFDIIKEVGTFEMPFGFLSVDDSNIVLIGKDEKTLVINNVHLPFCIRSRQLGDEILTADGNMKKVNDVLSSWNVSEDNRDLIPVIQELSSANQSIICICGSVYGYDDWIVVT